MTTELAEARLIVLTRPLEFKGTTPIGWEYDCRICIQDRKGTYSSYRVHAGELVRCLPDWHYCHEWHTAEEWDAYVTYLAEILVRGDNF